MNSSDLILIVVLIILAYIFFKYYFYTPYTIVSTPNNTLVNTTYSFGVLSTTVPGYITSVKAIFNSPSSFITDGCGVVIGQINYNTGGLYTCRFNNSSVCSENNLGSQISYTGILSGFNMYSPSSPIPGLTTQPPLLLVASNGEVEAVNIGQSDNVILDISIQGGTATVTLNYGYTSNTYTLNIGVQQLPNMVSFFCMTGGGVNGKVTHWVLYGYQINGEKPLLNI